MGKLHNLRIPCEVFGLQVVSAPQKGLSTLESLALRAIYYGADNLDLLDRIFMLGHRPLLDLVSDLWRHGHLRVDVSNSKLYVTENVLKSLPALAGDSAQQKAAASPAASEPRGTPEERTLEGGQRSFRRIELVHDLICDELLPEVHPEKLEAVYGGRRVLEAPRDLGSYRSLPAVSLEKAAIQRFGNLEEREAARADRQPHQLIYFSLLTEADTETSSTQRYLHIQVESVRGPTGRRRIEVVNPPFLSAVFRRRLSRSLTEMAEEQQANAKVLLELFEAEAEDRQLPRRSLRELSADAEAQTAELESLAPSLSLDQAAEHDDALRTLAEDFLAELDRRESDRARVRWIRGREELEQAALTSIGGARNQVVLSSPVIRWDRFQRFYDLLEKRLKEGLRVVLLWGTTPRSELEVEVRGALKTLGPLGDLQWSYRPMRTHASFLLRDADLGIFSGSAIFGGPTSGALSAVVRRPDLPSDAPATPEAGELESLRKEFPRVGAVVDELARVQRTALEMHIEQAIVLPDPEDPVRSRRPPDLDPKIFADRDLDEHGGLIAWAQGWRRWDRRVNRDLETLGPSASVVHDEQHLDWLEAAIESRPAWMVLGSGIISSRGLDQAQQTRFEDLARGGTRLLLLDGQRGDLDPQAAKALASLCRDFPEHVHQISFPFRGGFLVTDRFLLVTSLQLLDRPLQQAQDLARRRLHTGLLVRGDEQIRDGLGQLLLEHPQELRFLSLESAAASEPKPWDSQLDTLSALDQVRQLVLPDLKNAEDPDQRRGVWDRWTQRLPAGVSPLHAYQSVRSQLTPDFAKEARIATLRVSESLLGTEEGRFHLGELAEDLWRDGQLFEALQLFDALEACSADAIPGSASIPPRVVRRLIANAGRAEFTDAVLEVLESPVNEKIAVAGLCLAAQSLAETASDDAFDLLIHFDPHAPSTLRRAVKPLRSFYEGTLRPVPWTLLASLRESEVSDTEQARRLAAVRDAFENAENVHFNFTLGVHTWRRLFAADGAFGRLRGTVEAGDRGAAADWLKDWEGRGLSTAGVMDDVSLQVYREVNYVHDDRITHRRRDNYLKRLDTLVDSLRGWVGSGVVDLGSTDESTLDALRQLSAVWPQLRADIESSIPGGDRWDAPLCRGFAALLGAMDDGPETLESKLPSRLWAENAWRYPDLWIAGTAGDVAPERAVRALVQGLADRLEDPVKAMEALLEQGQVEAGLRLVPVAGRVTSEPDLLNRAAAGLRERRLRLLRRLRTIGPGSDPPSIPADTSDGERSPTLVRAAELIDREKALRALEEKLSDALRGPVADRPPQRPAISPPDLPAKLGPWPYGLSVAETVRSLRDQPQRFGGWSPAGEPAAARLVDLLASVLLGDAPLDRGWAADFAESLDQLLGAEPTPGGVAVRREDPYLVTTLKALPPSWPSTVRTEAGGWQLWIPCRSLDEPEPDDVGELALFFDPAFDPRSMPDIRPEWALRIRPDLVFRTLIGPQEARRYTWLCELARQVPLDHLLQEAEGAGGFEDQGDLGFLDALLDDPTDRTGDRAESHRLVAAFLDIGGFRGLEPTDVRYLVELTGHHRYWICRYLSHLCSWLLDQGRARTDLTSEVLDTVWHWDVFRDAIARDIDTLIDQRLDLAYLMILTVYHWIDASSSDGASREQIEQDNEYLDSMLFEEGLRQLDEKGLIQQNRSIHPPSGATGSLLIELVMDRWDDIEERTKKRYQSEEIDGLRNHSA